MQHKDSLNLILAILLALSLLATWWYAEDTPGIDYYVAWVAADAVKNDTRHNIYAPASSFKLAVEYRNKADALKNAPKQKKMSAYRRDLPMTATPFMYWLTGFFAIGDYQTDLRNWHSLAIFLLTASILVSGRLLGYSAANSMAFLLPVLIWFAPLHSDLRVANVNSFQLGMIGLILWLQSRSQALKYLFASGLVTGLLVMFKPNLAPIALLLAGAWVVRLEYARLGVSLAGMTAGGLAALLVSSWWLGNATAWLDWLHVINKTVGHGPSHKAGNFATMTNITGGLSPTGQLLLAVFLCLLCLAAMWWGRRGVPVQQDANLEKERQTFENTVLVAMGCIIALLASALVWLHYYLLTLPMFLVAFRPWRSSGKMQLAPRLLLRVLPTVALVGLLETSIGKLLGVNNTAYWVAATITSTVSLFVIGLWQFGFGTNLERGREIS